MTARLVDGRRVPAGTAAAFVAALARAAGGAVEGLAEVRVAARWAPTVRRAFRFNPALGDREVERVEGRRGVVGAYRVTLAWERDPRDLPVGDEGRTAWHAASVALLDLPGSGPHELRHLAPGHAPPGHAFGAGRRYDQPPIPTWHPTDARAARAAP